MPRSSVFDKKSKNMWYRNQCNRNTSEKMLFRLMFYCTQHLSNFIDPIVADLRSYFASNVYHIVISVLFLSCHYLFFGRGLHFPRIVRPISIDIEISFEAYLWLVFVLSLLRFYYLNQFLTLFMMETKTLCTSLGGNMQYELSQAETAYFSLRRMQGFFKRLDRIRTRIIKAMKITVSVVMLATNNDQTTSTNKSTVKDMKSFKSDYQSASIKTDSCATDFEHFQPKIKNFIEKLHERYVFQQPCLSKSSTVAAHNVNVRQSPKFRSIKRRDCSNLNRSNKRHKPYILGRPRNLACHGFSMPIIKEEKEELQSLNTDKSLTEDHSSDCSSIDLHFSKRTTNSSSEESDLDSMNAPTSEEPISSTSSSIINLQLNPTPATEHSSSINDVPKNVKKISTFGSLAQDKGHLFDIFNSSGQVDTASFTSFQTQIESDASTIYLDTVESS